MIVKKWIWSAAPWLSFLIFILGAGSHSWAKNEMRFAVTYAASQPYPYNDLTFSGIYAGNLLSNVSLEYSLSPYWAVTGAFGNDVLKWQYNQWTVDPVNQIAVTNVYLNTWHYLAGIKSSPWGEFVQDRFWKLNPYFTLEAGLLDLQAVDLSSGFVDYEAFVPMAGAGVGLEVGVPGEEEESEALRFFSRNVRFFAGLKYFVGFTPYSLQYLPLYFGMKIKF